jgi:hypothetical protein
LNVLALLLLLLSVAAALAEDAASLSSPIGALPAIQQQQVISQRD